MNYQQAGREGDFSLQSQLLITLREFTQKNTPLDILDICKKVKKCASNTNFCKDNRSKEGHLQYCQRLLMTTAVRVRWIRADTECCISRPCFKADQKKKNHNLISHKVKSQDLRLEEGNLKKGEKNVADWAALLRKFMFKRLLYWSAHAGFIHW